MILPKLFFGPPHFGAEEKQWTLIAKRYSRLPGGNGKASLLLEAMIRNSEDLAEVGKVFCQVATQSKIISFYEMKKWRDADVCIVDEMSARMIIDEEVSVGVEADYLGICRFADAKDPTFVQVCQRIEDIAAGSGGARQDALGRRQQQWAVLIKDEDKDEDDNMSGLNDVPAVSRRVKMIGQKLTDSVDESPWRREVNEHLVRDEVPVYDRHVKPREAVKEAEGEREGVGRVRQRGRRIRKWWRGTIGSGRRG
ncbi:hypothetical protein DL771_003039 [Monosporascus sp. 5C6A]|nr:hypothetical protein DL771_003039 [Monosporascus sp. 5C6A]